MNTPPLDQDSSAKSVPPPTPASRATHRFVPHGCFQWFLVAVLLFVLGGLLLPIMGTSCGRGSHVRALVQAKQIGLALKLFAGDHDGFYPRAGVPVEMKDVPVNSNQALAALFPTYTQSESIFGNELSAYQSVKGPDNVIDSTFVWKPVETLRPGENTFGYVMGLTNGSSPDAPIVLEGTDGTSHYNTSENIRGGRGKLGKHAVVVRVDNSAIIETLAGPDNTLYIPRPGDRSKNLLDVGYLGKDVRYLDPAVAGP